MNTHVDEPCCPCCVIQEELLQVCRTALSVLRGGARDVDKHVADMLRTAIRGGCTFTGCGLHMAHGGDHMANGAVVGVVR